MFNFRLRLRNNFVVLPPAGVPVQGIFKKVVFDNRRYNRLLGEMQRLRGRSYLEDGAIRSEELTSDGRHSSAADESAWHILSIAKDGSITTCLRFIDERHSASFRDLWVSHAAISRCPVLGWKVRHAVESKMRRARDSRLRFGSVGGWAAAVEGRHSVEPVAIILATYGLLELLGGCVGFATATFRHGSSSILRKIGLSPLTWNGVELPPYFDPQYGCDMEILEFDSGSPNPKYWRAVRDFMAMLSGATAICREPVRENTLTPAFDFDRVMAVA
jgi:hypothetical protein